jgi:phosphate transport system substrate-binding protein
MDKFHLIKILALFIIVIFTSCGGEDIDDIIESPYINGLTTNNYPNVDGSTSTDPLNKIIACKLFDLGYKWVDQYGGIFIMEPKVKGNNELWNRIKSSQTHNSYINLIDKKGRPYTFRSKHVFR